MDLAPALAFARRHRNAVLVTIGADGRPQSTNVVYALDDDDVVRVSITADRVKARNLRRDARASLHVSSDDFWSYVVLEAEADLTPVAAAPDDATVDELVTYYRALRGEHPDWADYRQAMVDDRRLVALLRPTRAYGSVRS